jgi:drug/metabolite transporter (DMT)-like permease
MGLVIVLAATVLLGVAYFLFGKSTKAIGPSNTTLFYYMFGFVFAVIIWIALGHRQSFSKSDLIWPALTALALSMSVLLYNTSFKYMRVSVATTIYSLSFVITVVLAILIGKEHLQIKDFLASGLAVAALVVFSL